jgi:hypothetical protein
VALASLTLIEEQEESREAREDARGATLGGLSWPGSQPIAPCRWRPALVLGCGQRRLAATTVLGYFLTWFHRA